MSGKKARRMMGLFGLEVLFFILCFITLIPILYAVSLSFRTGSAALGSGISFLPEKITLQNYRVILMEEPFLLWLKNSAILSIGTMVVAMATAVTAAYAFSRYRFRGRSGVMKLLLILNAFPQILSMFAIFRLFKTFHLLNTYVGLVIIYGREKSLQSVTGNLI